MPHIKSWEPCNLAVVPDGPHVKILKIRWLQKEEPRYACLRDGQSLAFTQDVSRGLLSRLTPPAQGAVGHRWFKSTILSENNSVSVIRVLVLPDAQHT